MYTLLGLSPLDDFLNAPMLYLYPFKQYPEFSPLYFEPPYFRILYLLAVEISKFVTNSLKGPLYTILVHYRIPPRLQKIRNAPRVPSEILGKSEEVN